MTVVPDPLATIDAQHLHVREALVCLAIGAVTAGARRWLPATGLRLAAAPLGAVAVSIVAVAATGRGGALPLLVALAAFATAAVTVAASGPRPATGDRQVTALVPTVIWLLGATIAWFSYLSLADTEGALAALGLTIPVAVITCLAPGVASRVAVATDSGALVALLTGAIVLGGVRTFSWGGWWAAKVVGAVVALVLFAVAVTTNGRGHPSRGPARARRG
jgi:hypothetical protein